LTPQATREYYRDDATARFSALIVVCIGSFLTPLSLSAALVAIPAIAADLHADAVYVSWIPAVFLISNLVTLLPAGRAADIYGRKKIYLIGNVVFLIGSVCAGLSNSIETLLVFRVVQGVGAAMFFGSGMAIISSVYQDGGRGAALGWVVASVYLGLSGGPVIGGYITDHFGWHYVFFMLIPFVLLGMILIVLKLKGEWLSHEPQKLDWAGAGLFSLWIVSLFIGLTNLPTMTSWIALPISAVLLYLFVAHCNRIPQPLIKLKVVWSNKNISYAIIASIFMYSSSYGLQFLMGLYLQYNRGLSPTEAGKMLLVQALMMAILAPISGRLSDRYPPNTIAAVGCLLVASSFVVVLQLDNESSMNLVLLALGLLGLGFGMFSTPNNNGALSNVPEASLGIASAIMNLSRMIGQLLGTALVTLLMSLYIGNNNIDAAHYDALLSVLMWVTMVSLCCALAAAYASFAMSRFKAKAAA
jgi:EmrB/QacA subfamily drug resistance transporter